MVDWQKRQEKILFQESDETFFQSGNLLVEFWKVNCIVTNFFIPLRRLFDGQGHEFSAPFDTGTC